MRCTCKTHQNHACAKSLRLLDIMLTFCRLNTPSQHNTWPRSRHQSTVPLLPSCIFQGTRTSTLDMNTLRPNSVTLRTCLWPGDTEVAHLRHLWLQRRLPRRDAMRVKARSLMSCASATNSAGKLCNNLSVIATRQRFSDQCASKRVLDPRARSAPFSSERKDLLDA